MNYVRYPAKNATPVAPHAVFKLAQKNDHLLSDILKQAEFFQTESVKQAAFFQTEALKQSEFFRSEMVKHHELIRQEVGALLANQNQLVIESLKTFRIEISFKYKVKTFFKKILKACGLNPKKIE